MKALTLLIDARYKPSQTFIDKSIQLGKLFGARLDILIDMRKLRPNRWYWLDLFENEASDPAPDLNDLDLLSEFEEAAESANISYTRSALPEQNIIAAINQSLLETESSLLVLDHALKTENHLIFQDLHRLARPLLILGKKPWRDEGLSLAVAVDPMHANSEDLQSDAHLLKYAKTWIKKRSIDAVILHSCYVPAYAHKHKERILKLHKDSVNALLLSEKFSLKDLAMLNGRPEDSIRKWLATEQTDLIMLGMLNRDSLTQQGLGSTSKAFIDKSPCDVLLWKPDNV